MTRRYGRAMGGGRAHDKAPAGHWNTTTLLCAVGTRGPVAPLVFEGPVDADVFAAWVEQFLLPTLRRGDVVVLDNLSSHKAASVRALIEGVGARLLFLPPYSPDLNPIEKMWSKIKTLLRGAKARTLEALEKAIAQALDAVTTDDIKGWFESCGYAF
jgi:transposase